MIARRDALRARLSAVLTASDADLAAQLREELRPVVELYEDLKPPSTENRLPGPERARGSGRPTKKQRREIERFKESG